jgi:pimeloyl-ACP methyl ester carboxylesterase
VGSIAKLPAQRSDIDGNRIGAGGGSGGGFVAAIAAARYPEISFVISESAPIVSGEEAGNFNIAHALRSRGFSDIVVDSVMPLWRRHHAAWASADTIELIAVAEEIRAAREIHDKFLLPTPYDEVFSDSGLVFMWPKFRSAARDYLSELSGMHKKWLIIYGENDPIVPVNSCVNTIERLIQKSSSQECSIIVIPEVGHSFAYAGSRRQVPVVRIVLNWLMENVGS